MRIITGLTTAASGLFALAERFLPTALLRRSYTPELKLPAVIDGQQHGPSNGGVPAPVRAS